MKVNSPLDAALSHGQSVQLCDEDCAGESRGEGRYEAEDVHMYSRY